MDGATRDLFWKMVDMFGFGPAAYHFRQKIVCNGFLEGKNISLEDLREIWFIAISAGEDQLVQQISEEMERRARIKLENN